MNQKNFLWNEFIGYNVQIINAVHPSYNDINGKIVDESKNTIVVNMNGKDKIIPKKAADFRFKCSTKNIDVEGRKITFRPENRIKKIKSWKR